MCFIRRTRRVMSVYCPSGSLVIEFPPFVLECMRACIIEATGISLTLAGSRNLTFALLSSP
jgi:hypothetical protein